MNWPRRLLALALGLGAVFFGLGQMGGAERLGVFLPPLFD